VVPAAQPLDAVVLLQLGGPETLDDVEGFLAELLSDPYVIRLPRWARPFQPALGRMFAARRVALVRPRYERIGGGSGQASPIRAHTEAQARKLGAKLAVPVHVAMRCSAPRSSQAVASLRAAGAKRVLLIPLYPHFSGSTTNSALDDFRDACRAVGYAPELAAIPSWGDDPAYVRLVADLCLEATPAAEETHLVLSAHSLPRKYIERGDPYQQHVERSFRMVERELAGRFASVRLGYQSAVGPVDWIGPSTDQILDGLLEAGAKRIALCPFGFVSDHIETLYDLDSVYRGRAEAGGATVHRVNSFNDDARFIDLLAGLTGHAPVPLEAVQWTR
jgi:protoporphyrin/coproporphyrin ferrochelatase